MTDVQKHQLLQRSKCLKTIAEMIGRSQTADFTHQRWCHQEPSIQRNLFTKQMCKYAFTSHAHCKKVATADQSERGKLTPLPTSVG